MKVGLVGCGGMGRHHLDLLASLPDFEIAAVCDVIPESAARAGDQYGVSARYADAGEMCDAASLDIVVVTTQTRGHREPTVAALSRGVSVLCEKPIALDLAEADEMVAAAEASGAKLAINQQNHVHAGILKAKRLIDEGAIGDLVHVRGRNKAGRKSGNEFMEMGTHVTDMMMRFGGVPEWCSGTVMCDHRLAEPQDVMEAKEMSPRDRDSGLVAGARASADYGFPDGVLGEIRFIDYAKTHNANYGVDALGTTGQLAVRASGGADAGLWRLPRPMEGTPAELGDWEAVDLSDIGGENPMVRMYRGLAEAIRNDISPPCDGATGRWAFEMIMGVYASHKEDGRRVPLPLSDRRHPLAVWRGDG